jgi:putative transposase
MPASMPPPGAVHHLMVRGITRSAISYDSVDRERFIDRAGMVFEDRTGITSLAGTMRRLLTGYAVSFNKRHKRSGHLFQNRYKSILC